MKAHILAALLFILLALATPVAAGTGTGVALVFTGNTWGEHSPCPS